MLRRGCSDVALTAGRAACLVWLLAVGIFGWQAGPADASRPQVGDRVVPHSMAVDMLTGKTYIGSSGGTDCRVFAIGPAGVTRHVAGNGTCGSTGDGGHARAASIEPTYLLAVDSNYVYLGSQFEVRRVQRTNGSISTFAGSQRYNCYGWPDPRAAPRVGAAADQVELGITGMAIDPVTDHVWVTNGCRRSLIEIDTAGVIVSMHFGTGTPIWAEGRLAFDPSGNLYFTSEPYSRTVYRLDRSGRATLYAGDGTASFAGDGGPATSAGIGSVSAMTVDSSGQLYIGSDGWWDRLWKVDAGGTITTVMGTATTGDFGGSPPGPASSVILSSLSALDVDIDDNLYVAGDGFEQVVGAIQAPVRPSSRWAWLMKDGLRVMQTERNGGGNPAVNDCDQACHGDPVNTATGEYWETRSDLAITGRGPAIDFARSYGSSNSAVDGPLGYGWTHRYSMLLAVDADGVVTVRQENGSEIWFRPDGSGGFVADSGQFATLEEHGDGTFTLVRRQREIFQFSAAGKLIAVEDLNGYATRLAYDGSGRLATITDEAGRTVSLAYDGSDRIIGLEDEARRTVAYAYDGAGDLVRVTDVRGQRWTYTYDADHRLLTRTDPNDHLDMENAYSPDGEVIAQEDGEENITRFSYEPGVTIVTSPEGRVTEYYYAGGQLVQKVEAAGTRTASTWRYAYDPVTRGTTSVVDPRGNRWQATYNAEGLRLTSQTPLGHSTSTTYDGQGNVLTHRDERFVTTTFTYDAGGNMLTRSTPVSGQTVAWAYAYGDTRHPGDLTRSTDPLGSVTEYAYDAHGDRESVLDPTGAQATTSYDVLGRPQTAVSPRGNAAGSDPADFTTTYAYDAAGNLLSQTDPLGDEQRWTYDPAGNQTSVTDEAGKQTRYTYDDADRLIATTRADLTTLHESYDADGLTTSRTDGAGARTEYTRDAYGRLASFTDPNRRTTAFSYDAAGNLASVVDPAREATTNTYDASNRLTGVAYSDGTTASVTFAYDASGRRTGITDATGTSTFEYDELGMLTQHTDGAGRRTRYAYDRASRLTTLTYPNSRTVTRAYDDAGRLTRVTDWLGGDTTFAYDHDDHLTRTTFPAASGLEDVRAYDAAGDLTEITMRQGGARWADITYDHDPRGLVSQVDQTGLPGVGTSDYGYTDLAELASENSAAYAHDRAGNLVEIAGTGPLVYDDAGQLLEGPVLPGSPTTTAEFDYDERGSRIAATPLGGSTTAYEYDQAERLSAFTPAGGTTTSYSYDGSGLRVSKTTGGRTTRFTWDRSGELPLLLGDDANSYVYGPGGLPIAHVTSGGTVRYYHQDALGSTRALSDLTGANVGAFSYTPYGALAASSGTDTTPLGYAGQQTDPESGLQYLRARSYDPATGQFLTRDPLLDQTGQPYAYGEGDPINNVDPSGSISWPTPDQLGTRVVGFFDGATFGATAHVRDALGLEGGLDTCSLDYRAANTIGGLTTETMGSAALGSAGVAARYYRISVFDKQARGGRGLFVLRDTRIAGKDQRVFALDRHPLRPRYEKPKTHIDMPQRDVRHWPYERR